MMQIVGKPIGFELFRDSSNAVRAFFDNRGSALRYQIKLWVSVMAYMRSFCEVRPHIVAHFFHVFFGYVYFEGAP